MKELVLDYILRACTFIYVINSSCAGGVQNRVSKDLEKTFVALNTINCEMNTTYHKPHPKPPQATRNTLGYFYYCPTFRKIML